MSLRHACITKNKKECCRVQPPACQDRFAASLLLRSTGSMIKVEKMVDLAQLMENEVFMAFASYTIIVLSKMMFMSTATAFYRITRKVLPTRKTASFGKGENAKKYLQVDDRVEHVGRAHLNDLENIVPFLGIGLLFSLSGPDLSTAILHFRLFAGARSTTHYHICYPFPSQIRLWLFFVVGYGVTLSMAYRLLKTRLYL